MDLSLQQCRELANAQFITDQVCLVDANNSTALCLFVMVPINRIYVVRST